MKCYFCEVGNREKEGSWKKKTKRSSHIYP